MARSSKNKYHNKKVHTEDGDFDSLGEYKRWLELKEQEAAGHIHQLRRQVRFELIPTQRAPDIVGPKGGRKPGRVLERAVEYVADFVYSHPIHGWIVEDFKSAATKKDHVYVLKRKLMLWVHDIRISEYTGGKRNE